MKILIISTLLLSNLTILGAISSNNVNLIVNSIYKIEGGVKTAYPYGIKSIKTSNPRQVCWNTVVNNVKRYQNQTKYTNYFEFLGSRYCPVENDKTGLNKNWARNLQSVLGQRFVDKINKDLTLEKYSVK